MLKSYEAIYENGRLHWLGIQPNLVNAKVIVVVEENVLENRPQRSIKQLKGIASKPERVISIEEINAAIELEGAKL